MCMHMDACESASTSYIQLCLIPVLCVYCSVGYTIHFSGEKINTFFSYRNIFLGELSINRAVRTQYSQPASLLIVAGRGYDVTCNRYLDVSRGGRGELGA